jgi:hypothetical protein
MINNIDRVSIEVDIPDNKTNCVLKMEPAVSGHVDPQESSQKCKVNKSPQKRWIYTGSNYLNSWDIPIPFHCSTNAAEELRPIPRFALAHNPASVTAVSWRPRPRRRTRGRRRRRGRCGSRSSPSLPPATYRSAGTAPPTGSRRSAASEAGRGRRKGTAGGDCRGLTLRRRGRIAGAHQRCRQKAHQEFWAGGSAHEKKLWTGHTRP